MLKINFYKVIIPLVLLLLLGYFSYTYFLKEYFLNNKTQTIKVDSRIGFDILELKKIPGQTDIYSFEMEITGQSKKPVTLVMGSSIQNMNQQIRIKGGKVDFQYSGDWYDNSCFILVKFEERESAKLAIDYRFIGQ
jgi:hypothetical protein